MIHCYPLNKVSRFDSCRSIVRYYSGRKISRKFLPNSAYILFCRRNAQTHGLRTSNVALIFSLKSQTFGLGQTILGDNFWGIWGIFGQLVSTDFGTVKDGKKFRSLEVQRKLIALKNLKNKFLVRLFKPEIVKEWVVKSQPFLSQISHKLSINEIKNKTLL